MANLSHAISGWLWVYGKCGGISHNGFWHAVDTQGTFVWSFIAWPLANGAGPGPDGGHHQAKRRSTPWETRAVMVPKETACRKRHQAGARAGLTSED